MNIFYLDKNLTINAQYYMDKHIIKQPLESAQLLCGALYFKSLHMNH